MKNFKLLQKITFMVSFVFVSYFLFFNYIMKFHNKHYIIYLIVICILIYLYTRPKYISYLPTFPIYNNDEAYIVLKKWRNKTAKDIDFFKLTDPSISFAFVDYVNETEKDLKKIITAPQIVFIIMFFKYLINRPRPYQIETEIKPIPSKTASTPALPAGHAFQAYYLAHVLSKRYPEKKRLFNNIAKRCDDVRVIGGIHYPSDGALSKQMVDFFIKINIF